VAILLGRFSWNPSVSHHYFADAGLQHDLKMDFFNRGPVPVLVMSLGFIAMVFLLHIWGKFSRN
jgi:hypothetical protein